MRLARVNISYIILKKSYLFHNLSLIISDYSSELLEGFFLVYFFNLNILDVADEE